MTKRTSRLFDTTDADFDVFWAAYPLHTGKADAQKAWHQVNPTPEMRAAILQALSWQTTDDDWLKDNGRYIPRASTYLRGRRWLDEPRAAASPVSERTRRNIEASKLAMEMIIGKKKALP